tara:strand:+ start:30108 stop:31232 length:1125 start_codon:yes stop_codon:yes gene_type:complete
MELFFTNHEYKIGGQSFADVPFFVDSDYKLIDELNDFFVEDLLVDGNINSKKTWKNYAYWLQDFMQWAKCNEIDWKLAEKKEIVAYRNWSVEECELSPVTVNARLSVLKRFYKYAVKFSLVEENPITEIESKAYAHQDSDLLSHTGSIKLKRNDLSLKVDNELPKCYSEEELKRLFKHTKSKRLSLMMRLMLECGLRREEVTSLSEKMVLELIKQAQSAGPGSEIDFPLPASICKGNKSRTVIVSYATAMKLMQYRATVRPKFVKKFKAKNKVNPTSFWLTQLGTEYSVESLTTEISRLGKKANISDAQPHRFRHTFATTLYSITGDLRLVQKLLGHSHIQTTTIYEHTAAVDQMGFFADYQRHIDSLELRGTA